MTHIKKLIYTQWTHSFSHVNAAIFLAIACFDVERTVAEPDVYFRSPGGFRCLQSCAGVNR